MWTWMMMLALTGAHADELAVSSVLSGETLTLRYSGAPAGEEVFFYVTDDGTGPAECLPNVPAGCLELVNRFELGRAPVDAGGVAELRSRCP